MATGKTGERVTLSKIRETYFNGDYEACLVMCDVLVPRDAKDAAEIVLLRARCLVQLRRGDHAIAVLRGLRLHDDQHDEYLTGRMLMSAAYVSLGRFDDGLKIGREAYNDLGNAHATVRSEVILNLAIAHYRKGEYAQTARLLVAIPQSEDIVFVRVLQYRGAVAWAHGDFAGSLDEFNGAFALLDRCQYHDRFLESQLLFSLSYLCAQLPNFKIWPDVLKRIEQFDWSVSGVALWRYYIALAASFVTEMLGDLAGSSRWAAIAEKAAPDPPARIVAWCRLAARFGRNGEKGAHEYFTLKACEQYEEIPKDARTIEHQTLPLVIAEELLYTGSPSSASRFMTYYAEVIAPSVQKTGGEGRRLEAEYASILGVMEEQRGNRGRAQEAYQRAYEHLRQAGLMRGAAIVAYRLFAMTGEKQYEEFIADVLRDASDTYWVKARLMKSRTEARLTRRQLEVVRLIAQGLSNKEIAAQRSISPSRARNVVAELFAVLGVRSRAELVTVAAARGLLLPVR